MAKVKRYYIAFMCLIVVIFKLTSCENYQEENTEYKRSCTSLVDNPDVFNSPNKANKFKHASFKKGTDMKSKYLVKNDNDEEFLAGTIFTYVAGGRVLRNANFEHLDDEDKKFILYTLSEEWECKPIKKAYISSECKGSYRITNGKDC